MADDKSDVNTRIFALRAAEWIGCSGAHKYEGKWMPCETHEELEKLSEDAQPNKKSAYEEMRERQKIRKIKGKKKRKQGWENLRETKPLGGFATLEGGGIVSAPISTTIYSGGTKSFIPGVSPRDNDPDVFTDIESARKRSRMLGCIGVRRMPSATGRTVWMPCTNNTDYSRVAGTTFLGRRNRQEAERRMIRTVVRREIQNEDRRRKIRNKSLFELLHESKGIGRSIGRAITPNSVGRKIRRTAQIAGNLNPLERRDHDRDGLIFDGTWREMPDPSAVERVARSVSNRRPGRQEEPPEPWESPTRNTWLKPERIKKGGTLKTSELLNYDRLRLRRNRAEQARVLGVTRAVIDKMHEPDSSLDPIDADKLSLQALGLHPALIWGAAWLEPDVQNEAKRAKRQIGGSKVNKDRENRALEMRRNGATLQAIADELGVSRQRAQQIVKRAIDRNEEELDNPRGARSQSETARGSGMIRRDERGRPIRQIDRRKQSLEATIKRLKEIGMSDEEINLLMTGDRNTKVDVETRDVDLAAIKRQEQEQRDAEPTLADVVGEPFSSVRVFDEETNDEGLDIPGEDIPLSDDNLTPEKIYDAPPLPEPRTPPSRPNGRGARSMSLSDLERTPPEKWPQNWKTHLIDWANSRPSFNIPYGIAQKFKIQGELQARDWNKLLSFYRRFSPEGRSARSSSTSQYANVGARRMAQIILDRVGNSHRNKPAGKRVHYHIVGPGGMGKSTLREHLVKTGLMPSEKEAALIDPDFIKMGIVGYNGGSGSMSVHRESAHSATHTVNDAAKQGMDIITEGTGYRLFEYKTTGDNTYKKVVHIAYAPYEVAEERVRRRNAKGNRQLPVEQVRNKGGQLYGWLTDHLQRGEIQDMYIWDTDVPEGAAPRVIAKIVDGVFMAIDEPKFKSWSEQHGGFRGGDANLAWFNRRYPRK